MSDLESILAQTSIEKHPLEEQKDDELSNQDVSNEDSKYINVVDHQSIQHTQNPLKILHDSLRPSEIHDRDPTSSTVTNEESSLRKASLVDCEINCEEVQADEQDIRRMINQKLIRNKNYFMDFMDRKAINQQYKNSGYSNEQIQDQQISQLIDKRSRSETPDKMSATEILFRAHQKLQTRRKESPQKLLEKNQQRQVILQLIFKKKAEELRGQIENSKKNWYEKIRIRQQIAKEKWKELLKERKAKLQDKLEQAEERRETELEKHKNKAKQEIQKIDETNYIVKMTMNNMKLDLDMKMTETQERRNQIIEENKKKKQLDRQNKEEAAEKRRQELMKETEKKIFTNQQKREQADQRRIKMLEDKKKTAQEDLKRVQVLQRKNDLGDRISNVMSFVNNSENIWEFLGNESDWQGFGINNQDELFYEIIQTDCFELEKLKLKKDAELLNQMIIIDEVSGDIYSRKEYLPYARKIYAKNHDNYSSQEDDDDYEDNEIVISPDKSIRSPQTTIQTSGFFIEETKAHNEGDEQNDDNSDLSEKDSVADETVKDESKYNIISKQNTDDRNLQNDELDILTDEIQNYMLYSLRLKMSMKRNILKKTLSEDLTWADFLKNESYQNTNIGFQNFKNFYIRSNHSTPEKKQEIPCESGTEALADADDIFLRTSNSSSFVSNKKSKKKNANSKNNSNNASIIGSNSLQNQNHSSTGNLSEKSRISSVVYPSKKKKNPNNKNQNVPINSELKASGSLNSFKKNSGSNQSSTQSLLVQNSFITNDALKDNTSVIANRKSTNFESDSSRKKQQGRLHSSSVQESSVSQHLINSNIVTTLDESDKFFDSQSNTSMTHTGSQMNQLIANARPILPPSKILPKKLSVNASKMLFPIREQKLLFKRPGKEGQFGKCKICVKIEDLSISKSNNNQTDKMQTINGLFTQHTTLIQNDSSNIISDSKILTSQPQTQQIEQTQTTSRKSLQNTPSLPKRRESLDMSNTSQSIQQQQPIFQDTFIGTPTQSSRLYQMHQKFWEKFSTSGTTNDQQASKRISNPLGSHLISENTPSPSKDQKNTKLTLDEINVSSSSLETSCQMNEQGCKELILKYLLTDNISFLRTDDSQKTIVLEGEEANKLIDYLENHEFHLRYCRLCDLIIPDHSTNEAHIQVKSHRRTREELFIKESEDTQLSVLSMYSVPGDIDKELLKEKEKALKRKVKRLKAQMIADAVTHESASYCHGKEVPSTNKKRFRILCMDLEKQVIPTIKDYDALENTLKEIIKILDMRKQADLHLMRKLKFIPILIEICKRLSVCHKNEFKHLGKVLEFVIKIVNIFCGLRENRNYMLSTNRLSALIELLNWCLNRPTQLFYGINFMPQLFHILTLHVKHRTPYDCQQMKEMFLEYLISSQITMKIKSKFQIINGPLDLSEMTQIPLFLLKSVTFLESLTTMISMDSRSRPIYEKSQKIAEHVYFVIQNTELLGIVPMITSILLTRNQPFKPSQSSTIQKTYLPQTILSLAITSVKIINNVFRMDYRFAQQMLSDFEISEQLYHLFNYLLCYTVETSDQQEDSKELLHETLLMVGYFCLNNEKNQQVLCKGESTLLQKLCNLPFPYFCDKKLKEILFPTMIQASYKNERSLAIMDQEISIEMLVDFIQVNLKEELPRIIEEEYDHQSISSVGHSAVERGRSPSISSTNSSQCSLQIDMVNGNSPFLPLYMRFPKKLWKDAIAFYSKVLY